MTASDTGRSGRLIVTNTLHAAGGRVAALVVWLLYTPYLLSSLGPERFGLWSLFFAITRTLVAFDLGLSQATLRYVADARARSDQARGGAFATLAAIAFLALGVLWGVLALTLQGPILEWLRFPAAFRPDAGFVMVSGAVVFVIMGIATILMAVAQGSGRFDLANLAMLAVTAQHAIGIPIVLSRGWGLRGLVINVGLGWLLGLIVADLAVRRAIPHFRWGSVRAARAQLPEAIRFGGPMQVAVAAITAHQHLDKFLLVPLVALGAVASYEIGYRASNAALTLIQLLLLAVLPAATALHARRDRQLLRELYQRGNRYVLAATVLCFAPLAAGADLLMNAWLGPGHEDAALVLRGLSLASGIFLMSGMGTSMARALGRTDLEAWFSIAVLAGHAAIAAALIPRLGLQGAMIAMVTSSLLGVVLFLWRLASSTGWSRWHVLLEPHLLPLLAAAAGMLAGRVVERRWSGGSWLGLLVVIAATAIPALVVLLASGYLQWREVRALLSGRGARLWRIRRWLANRSRQ